jgi:hypothetical protein
MTVQYGKTELALKERNETLAVWFVYKYSSNIIIVEGPFLENGNDKFVGSKSFLMGF